MGVKYNNTCNLYDLITKALLELETHLLTLSIRRKNIFEKVVNVRVQKSSPVLVLSKVLIKS